VLVPPRLRGSATVRFATLVVGLALFACGIVLQLESGLGLSPWDVLNQGLAEHTALSFGTANIAVAVVVLAISWALGARIGLGTITNAVLVGVFVDLLIDGQVLDAVADLSLPGRVAAMLGGIGIIGLGSGLYIGAGLGAGPRDSLMLVLARRSRVRIGVVRAGLEVSVTLVGLGLGGTVGIGTVAFAFGIGPAVELAFWALDHSPLTVPGVPTAPVSDYDPAR
jgi:uncharacterized protein